MAANSTFGTITVSRWTSAAPGARTGLEMILHPYCCPFFDKSFAALLADLELEEPPLAVTGEFGRTPKVNPQSGRDHWLHCYP